MRQRHDEITTRSAVIPDPVDYDVRRDAADLPTADSDLATEEMLINMGPQHPSTHGVLRLMLRTDGELILDVEPHIGYLHRCAETIGESVSYTQFTPYTDRLDYLAGMNNNLGYALAVVCFVPGSVLTLAAGSIFGLRAGVVIVLVTSGPP